MQKYPPQPGAPWPNQRAAKGEFRWRVRAKFQPTCPPHKGGGNGPQGRHIRRRIEPAIVATPVCSVAIVIGSSVGDAATIRQQYAYRHHCNDLVHWCLVVDCEHTPRARPHPVLGPPQATASASR